MTTTASPIEYGHARLGGLEAADDFQGTIRAAVVDVHDLGAHPGGIQYAGQPLMEGVQDRLFVIDRNDNG